MHVRRAISYAIDRQAMIKTVLFGNGKPANSFMPPQVPYYDTNSPGLQYDMAKAKEEMAQSIGARRVHVHAAVGVRRRRSDEPIAQILQNSLKQLGITIELQQRRPEREFTTAAEARLRDDVSLLDDGHRRPRRAGARSRSTRRPARTRFFTGLQQPAGRSTGPTRRSRRSTRPKRQKLYSSIQKQAADDAFMVFLFYSPYRYATASKVQGFLVYPTGNYHMEDVWLEQ